MKLRNVLLIALCLLCLGATAQAQSCNKYSLVGTYLVTGNGWGIMAMNGSFPVFAPAFQIGTASIDPLGNIKADMTNNFGGTAFQMPPSTGTIQVTADCRVNIQATCTAGCAWTMTGMLVNPPGNSLVNPKEIHVIFTSQTSGGQPDPYTGSMIMKQIGN